jgi:hypothetical protein
MEMKRARGWSAKNFGQVIEIILLVCSPVVAQQYIVREGHVHSVIVAQKDDRGSLPLLHSDSRNMSLR